MAATLKAVVSQRRLVRRADERRRVLAVEVMIATAQHPGLHHRPGQTQAIHDAIAAGTSLWMVTFDQSSLFIRKTKELITLDEALSAASNPDEFKLRIQGIRSVAMYREEWRRRWRILRRFFYAAAQSSWESGVQPGLSFSFLSGHLRVYMMAVARLDGFSGDDIPGDDE